MLKASHSRGISVADTPMFLALKIRKASDELPSVNTTMMMRNILRRVSSFLKENFSILLVSGTISFTPRRTIATAIIPGMIASPNKSL